MKLTFTFLCLAFSLLAFATTKDSVAIKYAATITQEHLSKHLHILASDEYGGRETGKESLNKAANYISNFYKTIGILPLAKNSYYQTYQLALQAHDSVQLWVDKKEFVLMKDFYAFPSYLKKEKISANIIFLGYGIES